MEERRTGSGFQVWQKLQGWQRASLVAAGFGILAAILIWSGRAQKEPEFRLLFAGLSLGDASQIVERLEEERVPYELREQGTAVLVPAEQVHRLRLALASEGLPQQAILGFESIEAPALGATDFDRRVQYLRALQGELTRSILQIEGVEWARVHVNLPEPSLFLREERPPSAAILIGLREGEGLAPAQVRGIANLVAASVEGMSPDQVAILDQHGRTLSRPGEVEAAAEGYSSFQLISAQQEFERGLEEGLRRLLEPALGFGNVAVEVTAALDFDRRTVEEERFEPINGDEGVLQQIRQLEEHFRGSGAAPLPAGIDANDPVAVYQTASGGESEYERTESEEIFAVNRVREQLVVAPGSVERISAAVVVNGELNPEEQEMIAGSVTAALGLDPARGDQISVMGIPFQNPLLERFAEEPAEPAEPAPVEEPLPTPLLVAAGAGLGLFSALVILALSRRRQAQIKERQRLEEELLAAQRAREVGQDEGEGGSPRIRPRKVVLASGQTPQDIAEIVRSWIAEE